MRMNRNGKALCKAALLLALSMLLLACMGTETQVAPAPTDTPSPSPSATPSPSPTPKVVWTEPEPTGEDRLDEPFFYTQIDTTADGAPLYAFTNKKGTVEYRTVGVVFETTDGVVTDRKTAFYPCDETGELTGTTPIEPEAERPAQCLPKEAEGLRVKKVFVPTENEGHYLDTRFDPPRYAVYGRIGTKEPTLYPADEDGAMLPGALAYEEADWLVSAFAPKNDPKRDGQRHIIVFIGTQSVVVFRAQNGDWEIEHIFICSTGDGGKYTPRGEFQIMRQYEYKAMSRMNGVMVYAQYSSRFKGAYLFHTTPTVGEHKNYLPNGKRQMIVAEYEKLGTDVSHGCVRLLVGDSYWIYTNCKVGTPVTVTDDDGPPPPEKPALIYEEPYMNRSGELGWDPTDPDPNNPYLQIEAYAAAMIVPTLDPRKAHTPRPTKQVTPKPTPTATPTPMPSEAPTPSDTQTQSDTQTPTPASTPMTEG